METASQNRKRGRPPELHQEALALYRGLFPDVQTRRGLENIYHQQRALSWLKNDLRFVWLCDLEKMKEGAPHAYKPSILTELGRIKDHEDMQVAALRLCELKPKTKDAVSMIRHFRLGERKPDATNLANSLIGILNDYISRFPSVSDELIKEALQIVYELAMERKSSKAA